MSITLEGAKKLSELGWMGLAGYASTALLVGFLVGLFLKCMSKLWATRPRAEQKTTMTGPDEYRVWIKVEKYTPETDTIEVLDAVSCPALLTYSEQEAHALAKELRMFASKAEPHRKTLLGIPQPARNYAAQQAASDERMSRIPPTSATSFWSAFGTDIAKAEAAIDASEAYLKDLAMMAVPYRWAMVGRPHPMDPEGKCFDRRKSAAVLSDEQMKVAVSWTLQHRSSNPGA